MSGNITPTKVGNNSTNGQLIQPSTYCPWSVEVVSAVPQSIMRLNEASNLDSNNTSSEQQHQQQQQQQQQQPARKKKKKSGLSTLDSSQINAGAVCAGWSCLGSSKGHLYVWPTNTNNGSTLTSPSKQQTKGVALDVPKSCVTLFHPDLGATSASLNNNKKKKKKKTPVLIALTPASTDAVFVYAAQPEGLGSIFVWKVTHDDVRKATTNMPRSISYAQTLLPLQRLDDDYYDSDEQQDHRNNNANNNNKEDAEGEVVTTLAVLDRHMVVLGTSQGGMICCTQTTIPVSLHAQRMMPHTRKSRGISLFGLFGGGDGTRISETNDGSAVAFCLPLRDATSSSSSSFSSTDLEGEETTKVLAVSQAGTVVSWTIAPTVASSHRVTTQATRITSFLSLFQEHLAAPASLSSLMDERTMVEPLQAKLMGTKLHVLVRTTQPQQSLSESGGDSRLYWVRLRLEQGESSGKQQIHWVDCQWLNRFPAPQDVSAMGMVLTQNDMAYTAFHQRSGGSVSSVIVMALSDTDDGNDAVMNGVDDNGSSTIVYEVDLPMNEIPAFLPNTFTNDVVTHGCNVLARSGLGIRMRVIPPVSSNRAALSPRAAARANPSAVLKLTNHIRSAFWQAYNLQDGSSKSGNSAPALPPSLLEASPVDLEEAIIANATQLHVQRSDDGAGWSIASSALSSNGLEWHLSFIQWLRQGGLYRSLTSYGKWRLLSLGQEVAAFLELVAPTISSTTTEWEQEQFTKLDLSDGGVAYWLKHTFDKVLHEDNMEHYQLWCGWFSSALATAITYRDERAAAPYDIAPGSSPPQVGSMGGNVGLAPKVPIWTSNALLQEVFGTLFQHWNHNPKQYHILPPQTVIVCIKAGLISFEDAASSAPSEETMGKYSVVKKLSIPLLRTLHPVSHTGPSQPGAISDDGLAFDLAVRHDYFEGICQIAYDHENKPDGKNFRLEPLLQSTTQCQSKDFETEDTFGQFVMRWHADKENYGHTIVYGRLCPESQLNYVLKSEDNLRPHRWIQSVHRGDFDGAASTLMTNAENVSSTTSETKWALCMAKLSNRVVVLEGVSQQSEAEARDKKIDNKLELVGVQKELLEGSPDFHESHSGNHLWSANRLLTVALQNVDQVVASSESTSSVKESATRFCYLGLLVALTFEDPLAQRSQTVQVWAKSISVDWESRVRRTE